MLKRILVSIVVILVITLIIFIGTSKPTARNYNVTVFDAKNNSSLIFDFDAQLDENYWNIIEDAYSSDQEFGYYLPKNIILHHNLLEINAFAETYKGRNYTTGLINTKGKFEFQYGRIIIKCKPAESSGLLSTIRLLPVDPTSSTTIDIIGIPGDDTNYAWTGIYSPDQTKTDSHAFPKNNSFAIYEFNWTIDQITLHIDNQLVYTSNVIPPKEKMYLNINLSVNQSDATIAPDSKFLIDYIFLTKQRTASQ